MNEQPQMITRQTVTVGNEQLTELARELGLATPTPMALTHLRCMTGSLADFLVTGPTICPPGVTLPEWTDQEAERAVPEFALGLANMLKGLLGLRRTRPEQIAELLLAAVSEV